jgi:hypothetical protein
MVSGMVSGKRRGSMVFPRFTWRTALLLATVVWADPTRALSDDADGAFQAASASPAAREQLVPEPLMRQAGAVLQQWGQWWREASDTGDVGVHDRSRLETPAQARRRVLRTLWRPYTLAVERDLKSILKQVSEETGLEYRFDPAALCQTGVDPAQAFVVYYAENESLVTVLREVLHVYGLQPGLEGSVVVIVALPSLPPGLQRTRPAGHAPIPDVSGGTVVVKDEPEETNPPEATSESNGSHEAVEKMEMQERLEMKEFYHERYGKVFQRELQACLALAHATSEQEQQLRALVERVENDLTSRWVDTYILVRHQSRAAKLQELYPEVRKPIESAILQGLQQLGDLGWLEKYERQRTCRAAHRQRAAIRSIVMCIDGQLALTSDQRIKLEEHLRRQWQPEWERALFDLSFGIRPLPQIPELEGLITPAQQVVWNRLDKIHLKGLDEVGNHGFFGRAPQEDATDDEPQANRDAELPDLRRNRK